MSSRLLMLLPELRSQILYYVLVSDHPVHICTRGLNFYIGGPLCDSERQHLAVIRTCSQLQLEGTRVFFQNNVFVFGDRLSRIGDDFVCSPSRRDHRAYWIDGRICEHARHEYCNCSGWMEVSGYLPRFKSSPDMCAAWLSEWDFAWNWDKEVLVEKTPLIRHLVVVLYHENWREQEEESAYANEHNNLALHQAVLFLEKLNAKKAQLQTLFVFHEPYQTLASSDLGDFRAESVGIARCLIPQLESFCKRLPNLHIHFSSYGQSPNTQGLRGPSGLSLSATTALCMRHYLLAKDIRDRFGGQFCPPGVSHSRTRSSGVSTLFSPDERYLLEYEDVEGFSILRSSHPEDQDFDIIHATQYVNLLRTHPWPSHQDFVDRDEPWFSHEFDHHGKVGVLSSAREALRELSGAVKRMYEQERDSAHRSYRWGPLANIPYEIQQELWDQQQLQDVEVPEAGDHLTSLMDLVEAWAGQLEEYYDEDEESYGWLPAFLQGKILFDAAMARGQSKITDFFHSQESDRRGAIGSTRE